MHLRHITLSALVALAACDDDKQSAADTSGTDTTTPDTAGDTSPGDTDPSDTDPSDNGPGDTGGDDTPLTADERLRAATVFGSCVPDDGIERYLAGIWYQKEVFEAFPASAWRCVATAGGGCGALEQCLGVTVDRGGPCERSCDGNVYTGCDDQLRFRMDCGRLGLVCDPENACTDQPLTETCDWDTFVESCEDGRPVYCSDYVAQGPVCAEHGLVCGAAPDDQGAVCRGPEGECETSSWGPGNLEGQGVSCAGSTLTDCVNGGRITRDCAAMGTGFGCFSIEDPDLDDTQFYCGLGAECLADRRVTCEGTTALVCNLGKIDRIDCTALGFTGCGEFGCTPSVYTR